MRTRIGLIGAAAMLLASTANAAEPKYPTYPLANMLGICNSVLDYNATVSAWRASEARAEGRVAESEEYSAAAEYAARKQADIMRFHFGERISRAAISGAEAGAFPDPVGYVNRNVEETNSSTHASAKWIEEMSQHNEKWSEAPGSLGRSARQSKEVLDKLTTLCHTLADWDNITKD